MGESGGVERFIKGSLKRVEEESGVEFIMRVK